MQVLFFENITFGIAMFFAAVKTIASGRHSWFIPVTRRGGYLKKFGDYIAADRAGTASDPKCKLII